MNRGNAMRRIEGEPDLALEEKRMRARVVGDFLRKRRTQAGLTQSELAELLSYSSAQFISNWERGLCLPPLEVLPKLCDLCDIPHSHLIEVVHRYQEELLELQKRKIRSIFRVARSMVPKRPA